MGETWKDIEGYEGLYQVSNRGRVRSSLGGRRRSWAIRSLSAKANGYIKLSLKKGGQEKTVMVHRLVAHHFLGPTPEGMEVHHKDHEKSNNHVANLEYVTHKQNHAFRARSARGNNKGLRHGNCKTDPQTVREVRRMRDKGLFYKDIAARTGLTKGHVGKIIRGELWSHID